MAKPDYAKYASFTRAELIRTIEVLAERERNLLNALARAGVMPWDRDVTRRQAGRTGGPLLAAGSTDGFPITRGRGPGERNITRNPRP